MSAITGILGIQGTGKTMIMTYFAKKEAAAGRTIYSNYSLKGIDYIPVTTLSDIEKMRNGVFLGDELWLWVFSRTSQSKLNKEINKIIMLNRKRDIDIYYTAQRFKSVDVMLRSVTNYFVKPFLKKVNNTWRIGYSIYDELGVYIATYLLKNNLEYYGQFYDTTEEISSLADKPSAIEKGIQLETKFASALKKMEFDAIDLLANSGKDSSWNYDIVAWKNLICFCFDVKGVSRGRICLKTFGNALKNQIKNAYIHKARPFLVFPDPSKTYLTNPNAWFLYPLSYYCDLINYSSDPTFNKLVTKSYSLNDILTIKPVSTIKN